MKALSQIAEQEARKLPEIKLKLGTNLVNKIDNIQDKYDGIGVKAGVLLGAVGGFFGLYNLMNYLQPVEEPKQFGLRVISIFLGVVLGMNLGLGFGRKYGIHKTKQLKREYPSLEREIDDYNRIKLIQTYNNIRP